MSKIEVGPCPNPCGEKEVKLLEECTTESPRQGYRASCCWIGAAVLAEDKNKSCQNVLASIDASTLNAARPHGSFKAPFY
jgi:hypothetical protein